MTRGKNAIASANRKARAAVETDIATYQRAVVNLTRERDEAREKLAKAKADAADEIRRLRAERDEGAGPQVAALRLKLERAQIALQQHKANVAREIGLLMKRYRVAAPSHLHGAWEDALATLLTADPFVDRTNHQDRANRRLNGNKHTKWLDQVVGNSPAADPVVEQIRQENERSRRRALAGKMAERIATK